MKRTIYSSTTYLKWGIVLLSLLYILLAIGMWFVHYQEFSWFSTEAVYHFLEENNWKYWFEQKGSVHTHFARFLQYMDVHYLYTYGLIQIIVNLLSMGAIVLVLSFLTIDLFKNHQHMQRLQWSLIFVWVVFIFSGIQDEAFVWSFHEQVYVAYLFPLLSFYFLVKFSQQRQNYLFYATIVIALGTIIFSLHYVVVLFVLMVLGWFLKIGWLRVLTLLALFAIAIGVYVSTEAGSLLITSFYSMEHLTTVLGFVLHYLGAPFAYVSFEPCFATSSIIGGIFLVGTLFYIVYLLFWKHVEEPYYKIIASYLFFYILTAISTLYQFGDEEIIVFRNDWLTPALIAWALLCAFYVHYFYLDEVNRKRVLTIIFTVVLFLFGYQIRIYLHYRDEIVTQKLIRQMLKLHIDMDNDLKKSLTRFVRIMYYAPEEVNATKMSIFTVNDIRVQFLKKQADGINTKSPFSDHLKSKKNLSFDILESSQTMKGSIDHIEYVDKRNDLARIRGWIYNIAHKNVPRHLLVFDGQKQIIGYLSTRKERKDVAKFYGTEAIKSGFIGYIKCSLLPKELYLMSPDTNYIVRTVYNKAQ